MVLPLLLPPSPRCRSPPAPLSPGVVAVEIGAGRIVTSEGKEQRPVAVVGAAARRRWRAAEEAEEEEEEELEPFQRTDNFFLLPAVFRPTAPSPPAAPPASRRPLPPRPSCALHRSSLPGSRSSRQATPILTAVSCLSPVIIQTFEFFFFQSKG